jgi:hypothetical protein
MNTIKLFLVSALLCFSASKVFSQSSTISISAAIPATAIENTTVSINYRVTFSYTNGTTVAQDIKIQVDGSEVGSAHVMPGTSFSGTITGQINPTAGSFGAPWVVYADATMVNNIGAEVYAQQLVSSPVKILQKKDKTD